VKVTIRKAQIKDLTSINSLTDHMHHYLAGLYGLELSKQELEEEHHNENDLEETLIAEDAEKRIVVGYMSFSLGRNEWAGPHFELEHLVVHQDYRGLGVARKLFKMLEEKAKQKKVNITTGTLIRNKGALKFYKKLGFKPLTVGLLLDVQKRIRRQVKPRKT
jgi:ribosomal protein S18 acetylase RimI-like enzyme